MSWRPRVVIASGAAAALLLAGLLWLVGSSGARKAPLAEMSTASHAVIEARAPGVRLWASEAVTRAEDALERGRLMQDAELDRFSLARDFRAARSAFLEAHAEATRALRQALRDRRAAGGTTGEALARAERAVAEASGVASALGAAEGALLLEARIALEHARRQSRDRDYRAAALSSARARSSARAATQRLLSRLERYRDPDLVGQWREWEAETVAASRRTGERAVIVIKELNELRVIDDGRTIATFHADMGSNSTARKLRSGDLATPEGKYRISAVKGAGRSRYYKALLLDYPSAADRERLRREIRAGRERSGTRAGSLIEIHGEGGRGRDWTDGCVALSNPDMDRLFRLVRAGTPVTIIGGRGHGGKFTSLLARHDLTREEAGEGRVEAPAGSGGSVPESAGTVEARR